MLAVLHALNAEACVKIWVIPIFDRREMASVSALRH